MRDVVVVGGGPAGAAAARLLALQGYAVTLLRPPPRPSRDLAESLPPSCRKLLEALGAAEAVDAAGFVPCGGNTIRWGAANVRHLPFPDGPGWQVERSSLAALLVRLARDAGAEIREGRAERVAFRGEAEVLDPMAPGDAGPGEEDGARAVVRYRPAGAATEASLHELGARFVLDCSGRAGVVASRGLRTEIGAPATTGLVGVWRCGEERGLEDEAHTVVESYDDGWAWSIPVGGNRRYAAVMVDPTAAQASGPRGLEARYREEVDKTELVSALTRTAELSGGVSAWGATPYGTRRFCGPGFLLVGDAAAFIDPLSSFGVKKALASAWLASVTVHTALSDPSREALALEFFEGRERAVTRSFHRQAGSFYREAAAAHPGPFWRGRAEHGGGGGEPGADAPAEQRDRPAPFSDTVASSEQAPPSGAPDVSGLREDPRVLAAFSGLRTAPHVRFRAGDGLRWTEGPVIRGGEIVQERRLATPSFPAGLRFLREVDVVRLVELVEAAAEHQGGVTGDVPDLLAAYERVDRSVPLPDFLGALSVLLAEGAIVNRANGASTP